MVACGPLDDSSGGLRVGLLFVAPNLNLSRVRLKPIGDPTGRALTVIWPPALNELSQPKVITNALLEVA